MDWAAIRSHRKNPFGLPITRQGDIQAPILRSILAVMVFDMQPAHVVLWGSLYVRPAEVDAWPVAVPPCKDALQRTRRSRSVSRLIHAFMSRP